MRLPPYDVTPALTWQDLWDQHPWGVLSTLLALCLLGLLSAVLVRGNRRLGVLLAEQIRDRQALQITASVFSTAREGIVITNPQADIIDVNDAFTQITGYTKAEVVGRNPRMLSARTRPDGMGEKMWAALLSEGMWKGELLNRRKNGQPYHHLTTITRVQGADGQTLHYISVFTDITRQKEYEERLQRQAWSDELTGLANRARFNEAVADALSAVRSRQLRASLAYIDLDGFKAINDHHGHYMGDQLLRVVGQRLQARLGPHDTLGRLGGDEFVLLLLDHDAKPENDTRLLDLLAALANPIEIQGLRLQLSGSMGVVSCSGEADEDADLLIRLADQAMFQAKLQGRNCYRLFDRARNVMEQDGHDMRRRMAEALSNDEFLLYYQPKVHMRTGEVIGVEALIRWQHPERGLLPPGAFLGHAVGHDIDQTIGRWVISQALDQMQAWARLGIHLPISINVSGEHLQHDLFLDELRSALVRHPELPAGSLELEVLESSALTDIGRVSSVIRQCMGMGVKVALDDFGTGYSTLSYLKQLPAQTLKIDQTFIRSMLDDRDDLSILQGVLGLAEAFDRGTVAEGVETPMHGLMLLQLGCEHGQGYGIARPMPASDIPLWIRQWQPPQAWREAQARTGLSLDLLLASVHWLDWVHELTQYLKGQADEPPAMGEPVSPFLVELARADKQGLAEAAMRVPCEAMVALAQKGIALRLAGQSEALQDCLADMAQTQAAVLACLHEHGYWI